MCPTTNGHPFETSTTSAAQPGAVAAPLHCHENKIGRSLVFDRSCQNLFDFGEIILISVLFYNVNPFIALICVII